MLRGCRESLAARANAFFSVSLSAGGDTDVSRDYEYTDWSALSDFSHRLALSLREASPPVSTGRDGWHADAAI